MSRYTIIFRGFAILMFSLWLSLQIYALIVQRKGDSPLPPLFGNFPAIRAHLERDTEDGDFSFAVVGDTKSIGTFEKIVEHLRRTPISFAVLLGDCSSGGSEEHHRYFRSECAEEYALSVPVFYVVGNHDVNPVKFPFERFEEMYGPSIFKFEYRKCLFIVLRILDAPYSNKESMDFLEELSQTDLRKYRYKFVFMHIPPPVSPFIKARQYKESAQLEAMFDKMGIDYVFAGDFHGYAESRKPKTTYIITGGGGSNLRKVPANQFHHAVVCRVAENSIDKRIIYVPETKYFEDRLEKFAIISFYPWMQKNVYLLIATDVLCILCIIALMKSVTIKKKENK
ncbi:MAG: Calcineurin-like phosphoesterase [candidate division BRC1 bacterium ADurb.Bin183]|nr:MAG: Calcineurin-like phosphoesterase [candidate division BRC1 bacterium ADurb.Bin183]